MSTPTGVVAFDPAAFQAQFPAFASVDPTVLTSDFNLATLYLDNSPASVVQDLTTRASLLNLITAHLAFLFGRIAATSDGSNAAAVGQMQSATEGSVSASFAPVQAKNAAFWAQSQYGLLFWQMAVRFRTFQYFPAPRFV